jgi:hypothetical protein
MERIARRSPRCAAASPTRFASAMLEATGQKQAAAAFAWNALGPIPLKNEIPTFGGVATAGALVGVDGTGYRRRHRFDRQRTDVARFRGIEPKGFSSSREFSSGLRKIHSMCSAIDQLCSFFKLLVIRGTLFRRKEIASFGTMCESRDVVTQDVCASLPVIHTCKSLSGESWSVQVVQVNALPVYSTQWSLSSSGYATNFGVLERRDG